MFFFGRVCICLWVISCRLMTIKAILLPSLFYLTNGHSGNEKSLLQFSHFCFYIYFISISGTIMTLYYLKSTPHDFLVAIKSRRHIYSIYAFIFCSRFKYTWNICWTTVYIKQSFNDGAWNITLPEMVDVMWKCGYLSVGVQYLFISKLVSEIACS